MQLHASLLVAVCYALSFPVVPAEPQSDRNEPIIELAHAATLDPVAVATLSVPGADPSRTTARLTVPAGAHWQTVMVNESLILTLESGELRVSMEDGQARIARAAETNLGGSRLDEIMPDQEVIMRAGDRLVAHGDGALSVRSDGADTTATLIRVSLPATP